MVFAFGLNISSEINKFLPVFNKLEKELSTIANKEDFGDGIKELYIGIICVSPQFDKFFKVRRPKYKRAKECYVLDGFTIEGERTFEYEIKIDFETLRNADDDYAEQLLRKAIITSTTVFEKFKVKINDFDFPKFLKSLEVFNLDRQF